MDASVKIPGSIHVCLNKINVSRKLGTYHPMQGFFFICEYLEITPQEFFNDELSNPIKYNNLLCDLEELDSEQLDIVGAVVKGLKKITAAPAFT